MLVCVCIVPCYFQAPTSSRPTTSFSDPITEWNWRANALVSASTTQPIASPRDQFSLNVRHRNRLIGVVARCSCADYFTANCTAFGNIFYSNLVSGFSVGGYSANSLEPPAPTTCPSARATQPSLEHSPDKDAPSSMQAEPTPAAAPAPVEAAAVKPAAVEVTAPAAAQVAALAAAPAAAAASEAAPVV